MENKLKLNVSRSLIPLFGNIAAPDMINELRALQASLYKI
jgi:hypothetical protein